MYKKRVMILILLILTIIFSFSSTSKSIMKERPYGDYYNPTNNYQTYFTNTGNNIYKPGTTVYYSYSFSSSSIKSINIKLYRLTPEEIFDYRNRNDFKNLIDEWKIRLKPKISREVTSRTYDEVKKKYNKKYDWDIEFYKRGKIYKKLDKGIYLFVTDKGNRRLYIVSDLELLGKVSKEKNAFILIDSKTNQVKDAEIKYNDNSEIKTFYTKNGFISFDNPINNQLYVSSGDDELFIDKTSYYRERNIYRENTNLESYTDRPVYRPNQTVHFKAILWRTDTTKRLLPRTTVSVIIRDSRSKTVYSKNLVTDEWGAIYGNFLLDEEANIGEYRIDFSTSNEYYMRESHTFKVEEYRKPEFKLEITPSKDFFIKDEQVTARINANYYFGDPVANTVVNYKIYRSTYYNPCPSYYECIYNNDAYYRPGYGGIGQLMISGKVITDEEGIALLSFTPESANSAQRYYIEVDATDKSRKQVEKSTYVTVAPAEFYITTRFDQYSYAVDQGTKASFTVKDYTGVKINTSLNVKIFRHYYLSFNNQQQFFISEETVPIINGEGYIDFIPEKGGDYEVIAETYDKAGNLVSISNKVRIYGKDTNFYSKNLNMVTDKTYYFKEDTARVFIESPVTNVPGLFTVEGSELFQVTPIFIDSHIIMLDVPIDIDFSPNVYFNFFYYVNDTIFQANQLIDIPPVNKKLDIDIKTDQEFYSINDIVTYDIIVKDSYGNPQQSILSLGVVDEPIYDIAPDNSPDLFVEFNQRINNIVGSYKTEKNRGYTDKPWFKSIWIWILITFLLIILILTILGNLFFWRRILLGREEKTIRSWKIVWSIIGILSLIFIISTYVNAYHIDWIYFTILFNVIPGIVAIPALLVSLVLGLIGNIWFLIIKFFKPKLSNGQTNNQTQQASQHPRIPRLGVIISILIPIIIIFVLLIGSCAYFGILNPTRFLPMREGMMNDVDGLKSKGLYEGFDDKESNSMSSPQDEEIELVDAKVRKYFPDTLLWMPEITTDQYGKASASIELPDSLTTWRATVIGYTKDFKAGSEIHKIKTRKNIMVRLQTPRTFTQSDEVTVSGIVHNYLDEAKVVYVTLNTDDKVRIIGSNNDNLTLVHTVQPNTDERIDFKLKIEECCNTVITIYAQTDVESDAMELTIPIIPMGVEESIYEAGLIIDNYNRDINIPYKIDKDSSEFIYYFSPTLAKTALQSLGYLTGFPHGCVEQTMNKFLPNIIVLDAIDKLGLKQSNLRALLPPMVNSGISRLYTFQHQDGGFGWWKNDQSDPHMTAFVADGLIRAKKSGFNVDEQKLTNAMGFVAEHIKYENDQNRQAYEYYVLSKDKPIDIPILFFDLNLNDYGRSLIAMALYNNNDTRYKDYMNKLLGSAICEQDYCYWKSSSRSWRYNDIETTSYAIIALIHTKTETDFIGKGIRYLIKKKRGNKWYSTKDTSLAIYAITEYLKFSDELNPDYYLRIYQDDEKIEDIHITKDNVLDFDGTINFNPEPESNIRIEKEGTGKLYYSSSLDYYIVSEDIAQKDNGFGITRTYSENIVESGEEFTVTMIIRADEDYEYVHIEEFIPSGAEIITKDTFSSSSYYNVRDEKIDIFYNRLSKGTHTFTYKMRAEIPGIYTAMPARVDIMYSPEIFGHSGTTKLTIYED